MPIILAQVAPPPVAAPSAVTVPLPGAVPPATGPNAAPSVITGPDWRRKPTGADFARVYPSRAMRAGVEGFGVFKCGVLASGDLTNCAVIDEGPAGYGFGQAALELSVLFKIRPLTKDGRPVDGGTVRVPIRFILRRQ